MAERYTKVFELPENIYVENSPVIILAGALLKDNQTEQILAQLKIKNVTDKKIIALKVSIVSYDTAKNVIGEELIYNYLDLSADRDDEFGQKIPVLLGSNLTRSFTVKVTEIVFADDCIWHDEGKEWKSLIKPRKLEDVFGDSQLANQYKIEYGEMSEYEVVTDRDLWICSCGHINHKSEKQCLNCNNSFDILTSINLEELNEKKNLRILKEQKEYEIKQKEKKKNKIIATAVILVLLAIILGSVLISSYNEKKAKYDEACAELNKSNYNEAIEIFESLGTFKDSDIKLKEAKYTDAMSKCMASDYETIAKARSAFESLGDYKDSKGYALYASAKMILVNPSEYQQYDNFIYHDDYREDMKSKFETAKSKLEPYEAELPENVKLLYEQINKALDYYDEWIVVSGNKKIAFNDKEHDEYNRTYFAIDYVDSEVVLYLLPRAIGDVNRVWVDGLYTTITENVNEPFECENYDKNKCTISDIKDHKVVIKEYKNGKVVNELTLKKSTIREG